MLARKVKVFRNGRSRAIRIPKEFDLPGDEVMLSQQKGGRLMVGPVKDTRSFLAFLATLEPLDEDIGEIEDSTAEDVNV